MRVSIASEVFDPSGYIDFVPLLDSQSDVISRRVSRVATLDSGVAVTDRGFSHGDSTLVYNYRPVSKEHDARARRLVKIHPFVTISNDEGVFRAVPQELQVGSDQNTFTLLVVEKLSED